MSLFLCPICDWRGSQFLPKHGRKNVICPHCGSFERHRHQYLLFKELNVADDINRCRVLHIAPKPCIARFLSDAQSYVSVDIVPGRAILTADIQRLPFDNYSFEVVWCSHVLEHIQNVDKAIAEIHRILCIKGIAIMDVPITRTQTKRFQVPGNHGHYWEPGKDWFEKYNTFYKVTIHTTNMVPQEIGVLDNSMVVACTK